MSTPHHKQISGNLIAASAGTGKTYQLTSRFVALLALGARPEKMIALTFTKKAAGEFRNRIFRALFEREKFVFRFLQSNFVERGTFILRFGEQIFRTRK